MLYIVELPKFLLLTVKMVLFLLFVFTAYPIRYYFTNNKIHMLQKNLIGLLFSQTTHTHHSLFHFIFKDFPSFDYKKIVTFSTIKNIMTM